MGTLHELELIDSATRAQQAVEGKLGGETMILNMGPSHPSTHGVLRIVLELDGEEIVNAWPDIGYLHRGDEKIAENMTWTQFIPYTDLITSRHSPTTSLMPTPWKNSAASTCRRAADTSGSSVQNWRASVRTCSASVR